MMKGSEGLIYKGQIKEDMFSLAQQWLCGDHQIAEKDLKDSQQKGIEGRERREVAVLLDQEAFISSSRLRIIQTESLQ